MAHALEALSHGDEATPVEPNAGAGTSPRPRCATLPMTATGRDEGTSTPGTPPIPTGALVIHWRGTTTVSRLWADGDGRRCQLCPREMCSLTDEGMCLIRLDRHVPDHLAAMATYEDPSRGAPSAGARGAIRVADVGVGG